MSTTNRAVLAGVVAVVSCTDGATKEAITNKLQRCGARVASRLSNDVTHVVFKGRGLTVNSRAEQERDLWDVYCMIDKLERPPVVVSPLWLEACIKEQMRAQVCVGTVLEVVRAMQIQQRPPTGTHLHAPPPQKQPYMAYQCSNTRFLRYT